MITERQMDEERDDAEELHLLRLRALLHEMVRDRGRPEAARELGLDPRTVGTCMDGGAMSWRVREALERALLEGARPAADQQRERNDALERRVEALEKEMRDWMETLGKDIGALREEQARALRQMERRLVRAQVPGDDRDSEELSDAQGNAGVGAVGRRPYADVVTTDPRPDDEEVFDAAWPLVEEWRRLRDVHPGRGKGLNWLSAEERIRELEVAMLEEHGLTLPPEKEPLRGLWRGSQLNWRKKALNDVRKARARRELLRCLRRVLTLGLWWK